MERVYVMISALLPRKVIMESARLMVQGGFEEISARVYVGFAVFFSLAVGVTLFFLTPFVTANMLAHAAVPLSGVAASLLAFYLLLLMSADTRAQKIEAILPEVLQIISANIRAGMTLENAIWGSARPEFGPLRDEIKRVSADTFGGVPIEETLSKMTKRVRSGILDRSIKLINEGIKLGGEMAQLLDAVAVDIRSEQLLRKEIITSTLMYGIFIVFATVLAAPILFSISTFYSEMNEAIIAKQVKQKAGGPDVRVAAQQAGISAIASFGQAGGKRSPDAITAQDVFWFSLANIILSNICAALILGLIQDGKALRGIKFIMPFLLVSVSLYLFSLSGLRGVFGTFLK